MASRTYVPGDFDLVVKRSRTGLGLFTNSEIPRYACVIEYTGPTLTQEQLDKTRSRYLFEVTKTKTIDGAVRSNTARYINHSCDPNCYPMISKGRVYICALRRIEPGEELNYDYGEDYFNRIIKRACLCSKCVAEKSGKPKAVASKTARKASA